jgi:hypothetical protein
MKLATYLVNSTKKEYVLIGGDYPAKTGIYLGALENSAARWNLIHDDICIRYCSPLDYYTDVKRYVYVLSEKGGEIIPEFINLYDLAKF